MTVIFSLTIPLFPSFPTLHQGLGGSTEGEGKKGVFLLPSCPLASDVASSAELLFLFKLSLFIRHKFRVVASPEFF